MISERYVRVRWRRWTQNKKKAPATYLSTVGIPSGSSGWTMGRVRECLSSGDKKGTYNTTKGKNILGKSISEKGTKSVGAGGEG